MGRAAVLGMILLAGSCAPIAASPLSDCAPGPVRRETLASVGERGEIQFVPGARAVLSSLRWPDDGAGARVWLGGRVGLPLLVVPRGSPDRWGRERLDAATVDGETDFAGGLIAEGLAYADPGEAEALCRPGLRLVEAVARARRLGVWRLALPAAEDGPALRERAGRFTVVEGRIRHVGERSARSYLDFVPRGIDGLTVTVAKRTWRAMADRGLTAASLRDRRVRVHGLVDVWRGPTIEAATADAIEILDDDAPGPHDGPAPDGSGVRR